MNIFRYDKLCNRVRINSVGKMGFRKFSWNQFSPLYVLFRTQRVWWWCRFFRHVTLSLDTSANPKMNSSALR